MWDRIKSWAKWGYDWITVLTAAVVGFLTIGLDFLSTISSDLISPFLGADKALKIVSGVAIAKGLIAYVQSRQA